MFWIFSLFSQVIFGAEINKIILGNKYDYLMLIMLGIPVGIGVSTLIFFGCGVFLGFTKFNLLIHTGGVCFVTYSLITRRLIKKMIHFSLIEKQKLILIASSFIISLYVSYKIYRPNKNSIHPSTIPYVINEISLINSFNEGVNSGFVNIFKVRHPFCYQCISRTNWLTACHSAIMICGGCNLHYALIIPSSLLITSICYIFYHTIYEITNHVFYSISGIFILLFLGSFGIYHYADKDLHTYHNVDFVHSYGAKTVEWCHPIYQYLYGMRSSQLALSLSTAIVYLLLHNKKSSAKQHEYCLITGILGLLIPTQFQTFVSALIYFISFILQTEKYNAKKSSLMLILMAMAFGATGTLPILQYLIPRSTNIPLISFGATVNKYTLDGYSFPLLRMWFERAGLALLIPFGLFFLESHLRSSLISMLIVFIVGLYTNYSIQQENNINYFYPICAQHVAITILVFFHKIITEENDEEKKGYYIGISIIVIFFLTISSFYGFIQLFGGSRVFYDKNSLATAKWISKNLPKKAVFAGAPDEFSLVSTLSGHVLYTSINSLLDSSNFNCTGRDDEVRMLLKDQENKTLIPKVEYVLHNVVDSYIIDENQGKWTIAFQNNAFTIYKRNLEFKKPKKKT